MSICDLCRGHVPRVNDVYFLEKVALFLDKEEKGMLDQEFGITDEMDLVQVLGFEMTFDREVIISRHLEPVFDRLGKVVCSGDSTRMRIIILSNEDVQKIRDFPVSQKRIKGLKEAYRYLKVLSINPYNRAMERGKSHAEDT